MPQCPALSPLSLPCRGVARVDKGPARRAPRRKRGRKGGWLGAREERRAGSSWVRPRPPRGRVPQRLPAPAVPKRCARPWDRLAARGTSVRLDREKGGDRGTALP